ncbi:MAG: hypothetical protein WC335_04605 [Candidatus Omnitrophota bacterium]|jgi:type II secretory pathway pseudopilin PulG
MRKDQEAISMCRKKTRLSDRKPTGGASVPPFGFGSRGFSILEVVISLILLGIGVMAVGQGYKAGRVFLRQSDNRSYAIGFANQKMEEYLAKTYEDLKAEDFPKEDDFPPLEDKRIFHWKVSVEKLWEGDDPDTEQREGIPYKLITVKCSYQDRNMAGGVENNEVCLINIVSYPAIHTEMTSVISQNDVPCGQTASIIITLPIEYETDKNLMIVYNITIRVLDASGIGPLDTIFTECTLDGNVKDIVTRTPILMQPLISNALGVQNVQRDTPHTIAVRWYKDTAAGNIILKEANLVILATERK